MIPRTKSFVPTFRFIIMFVAMLGIASTTYAADFADSVDLSPLRTIAVQHRQSIKTLDSYAREMLDEITGHSSLDGHGALYSILDIVYHPDEYQKRNIIYIENVPLRREFLRLPSVSPAEGERILKDGTVSLAFWSRTDVQQLLADVQSSDTRKATALQEASQAANDMANLVQGNCPFVPANIVPPATASSANPIWHSLTDVAGNSPDLMDAMKQQKGKLPKPLPGYKDARINSAERDAFALMDAWRAKDVNAVHLASTRLAVALKAVDPVAYPPAIKLKVEVIYNRLAKLTVPGAAFYFVAFVFFLMSARSGIGSLRLWGLRFFAIALLIHTAGIGVRWWLVGSIPIKNEFESVMFSAWFGAMVGGGLELWKGRGYFGAGASFVGCFSLLAIFAVPFVFGRQIGGNISQVNGVLMSYWLYIHVVTVTAAYALIGMGFLLSLWWLIRYYRHHEIVAGLPGRSMSSDVADRAETAYPAGDGISGGAMTMSLSSTLLGMLFVPRAVSQAESHRVERVLNKPLTAESKVTQSLAVLDSCNLVVLQLAFWVLGAGIVFGAIWADHSWGRPWGWDPKETFALVTWIVYLIVVHVRVATDDKAWWTAVLSCIGFFIMLFNWIGVNFFLVGLHSYA